MRTKPDPIGHFQSAKSPEQAASTASIPDDDLPEPEILSEKQWNTISCLLACDSLQSAADSAGINVRTLRRWLRTPVFLEEYNRTRRQHLDHVGTHLQSAAADAAATLMRLLKCGDPLIELRAARTILQLSQKAADTAALEQRIVDLEDENLTQAAQIEQLEAKSEANYQMALRFETQLCDLEESLKDGTYRSHRRVSRETWNNMFSGQVVEPLRR